MGLQLLHDDPRQKRNADPRLGDGSLRPLPRVHPWAPHQLAIFDTHVRFITDPPDGLVKSATFDELSEELRQPFAMANEKRMKQLEATCGSDAVFIFTDASRNEQQRRSEERCAGCFVACYGADPTLKEMRIRQSSVPVSPVACIYSGELASIDAALTFVFKHRENIFRDRKNRNIVLVSDSKSSLESIQTTWLRRIGHLEQDVARRLFDLASCDVRTTLAFVFSHVGGAPGNDYADELAQKSCSHVGAKWTNSLWHVDTTRRILRNRHETVDREIGTITGSDELAFRFRSIPAGTSLCPSKPMPRDMSRANEVLVFRARLGMLTAAGGMAIDRSDNECPLCRQPLLGRNGATLTHVVDCLPKFTVPPLNLDVEQLWNNPSEAGLRLALATAVVKSTPLARERAAEFAARNPAKRHHSAAH